MIIYKYYEMLVQPEKKSKTHTSGEFANHAVPRAIGLLGAVLAVGDQSQLIIHVQYAKQVLSQVDTVAFVPTIACKGAAVVRRFLHVQVRR